MAAIGFLDPAGAGEAGFGAGRRLSLRGLVLAAAAQAAFLPLALSLSHQMGAPPEERLVTMDLSSPVPPPPPPPASSRPPRPDQPPLDAALTDPPVPFDLVNPAPVVADRAWPPAPPVASAAPAPQPPASAGPVSAAPPAAPAMVPSDGLEASLVAGDPPRYPHESRRRKEQGTVSLLVIVSTHGHVEAISVARSSGSPRLDQAALKAVSGWRWQPQRSAGQPVKVRGIVEIPFVLTSGRKGHERADCDTPNPRCGAGDDAARGDRRSRMDRRDRDLRDAGPDGEEQPPIA